MEFRKNINKIGLPPGAMIHTGEPVAATPKLHVVTYDAQGYTKDEIEVAALPASRADKVTWINLEGVHQPEIVRAIGERFGVHPLVLEDIVHTVQRPKLEEYDEYCYITLRVLLPSPEEEQSFRETQLSMILFENLVLTFSEFGRGFPESILKRIANAQGKIRLKKADYLAYVIVDSVVDEYFLVLEDFGETIERLEDEVFTEPDNSTLEKIHGVRRDLTAMRKAVWPLREMVNRLVRDDVPFIVEDTYKYFRDVYDHSIQIVETIESMRDLVSGLFDIYLSSISNRMNEVMKVLTVIATIFIPLTFLAGVYGMNFHYMPELEWKWGYFTLLGVMAGLGLGMAAYFKRKGWF